MILIYCPFPDENKAIYFSKILIEKKLIACAQVLSPMKSIYQWENKIIVEEEFLLLLKTKKENFKKIENELSEHHPYDIPCLLEIPINLVNSNYLNWMNSQIS